MSELLQTERFLIKFISKECRAHESGPDDQRRKTVYTENGKIVTKYFAFGNYEETVENGTGILYISSPDGIIAMRKTVNGTSQMYYVLTDHLGSIDAVVPAISGTLPALEYYSFDAWGNRRNPSDWSQTDTRTSFITDRGYTGHEMLDEFGLINANGRIYEPATGRFLSPDNYVQSPDFSQSFNRYAYGYNNPLMFTDPDGEIAFLAAAGIVVASAIGGYAGYRIAESKGYDMDDWQTYAYMVGGAAIGGFSAFAGSAFTAGGGFLANTAGIIGGSVFYSMGMTPLSSGQIAPNIGFGVASMDLGSGAFGYLGKKGNKWYQDAGYAFGALANIQDAFAGVNGTNIDVQSRKQIGGHSEIKNNDGDILISVGPNYKDTPTGYITKAGDILIDDGTDGLKWEVQFVRQQLRGDPVRGWNHLIIGDDPSKFSITLNNVNGKWLSTMTKNLNAGNNLLNTGVLKYGVFYGCVNFTSRALFFSGVLNINALLPVTSPLFLQGELFLRQMGIFASPYLTQN